MSNQQSAEREALLPCPFCGNKADFENNFGSEWWVKCEKCDALHGVLSPNISEAQAIWNRRPASLLAESGAAREPLTDAEIVDAYCVTPTPHQFVEAFKAGVRHAEATHGITTINGAHPKN